MLRSLDLSKNKLPDIPSSVGQLAAVKTINLSENTIELYPHSSDNIPLSTNDELCLKREIPDEIAQCSRLDNFNISNNCLTLLNPSMAALKHLRNLNASHNQLTSFPSFVCDIATLDYLDLSHNMIDLLPSSLETLKVVEINLNNNKVPQLPASIAQCPRLKVLRVEQNELILSGIPDVLLMDSKISLLAAEGNNFSMRDLEEMPGYDKYLERFSAVRRKLD
ncbi:leucine-rich repeat-containing protein 57-like isoform X3 [Dysidea avara]